MVDGRTKDHGYARGEAIVASDPWGATEAVCSDVCTRNIR